MCVFDGALLNLSKIIILTDGKWNSSTLNLILDPGVSTIHNT